jgi:hypothetical protein
MKKVWIFVSIFCLIALIAMFFIIRYTSKTHSRCGLQPVWNTVQLWRTLFEPSWRLLYFNRSFCQYRNSSDFVLADVDFAVYAGKGLILKATTRKVSVGSAC